MTARDGIASIVCTGIRIVTSDTHYPFAKPGRARGLLCARVAVVTRLLVRRKHASSGFACIVRAGVTVVAAQALAALARSVDALVIGRAGIAVTARAHVVFVTASSARQAAIDRAGVTVVAC